VEVGQSPTDSNDFRRGKRDGTLQHIRKSTIPMVKIRLRRMGAKKQPTYRFVVTDARSPRDGRFIEIVGHYNPRTEPKTVVLDEDKVKNWLSKGAQPSDPVRRLLAERGLVERGPISETKRPPKSSRT